MPEATAAGPRPRLRDHLHVAWLLVCTLAGVVPLLLWFVLSPVLKPWFRARTRARLRADPGPLASPPVPSPADLAGSTVFVVAGEASGDRLLASVVARIRAAAPDVRLRGYAGPACAEQGVALDLDLTRHATLGVWGVVASLGLWWRLCARTLARWREERPDLLLTVDFPGLNVRFANWARRRGIRTVHLVAPQLWAHTPWRILRWRRGVDRLLATYPFEPLLFERSGLPTHYVGHPLFEAPLAPPRTEAVWAGEGAVTVEIWPGSRRRELRRHARLVIEAAADVAERLPAARFRVRLAEPGHAALFEASGRSATRRPAQLEIASANGGADEPPLLGALACSGTVTAQLAARVVPMAIFYGLAPLERLLSPLFTAPWFGLVNLILGRAAVPERVCTLRRASAALARDFLAVAGDPAAWSRQRADLVSARERLEAPGVAERVAHAVLAELETARRR